LETERWNPSSWGAKSFWGSSKGLEKALDLLGAKILVGSYVENPGILVRVKCIIFDKDFLSSFVDYHEDYLRGKKLKKELNQ